MYEAAILLDFAGTQVGAELQLPLEQARTVFGKPINAKTLYADRGPLEAYIVERFHAKSSDGRPFQTQLRAPLSVETADDAPYLVARLILTPPAGSQAGLFDIEDDVLPDRLQSAVALVSVRSD